MKIIEIFGPYNMRTNNILTSLWLEGYKLSGEIKWNNILSISSKPIMPYKYEVEIEKEDKTVRKITLIIYENFEAGNCFITTPNMTKTIQANRLSRM